MSYDRSNGGPGGIGALAPLAGLENSCGCGCLGVGDEDSGRGWEDVDWGDVMTPPSGVPMIPSGRMQPSPIRVPTARTGGGGNMDELAARQRQLAAQARLAEQQALLSQSEHAELMARLAEQQGAFPTVATARTGGVVPTAYAQQAAEARARQAELQAALERARAAASRGKKRGAWGLFSRFMGWR